MKALLIRETTNLGGRLRAPSSKSYTHRAIIAASLSDGESRIQNPLISDDTLATIKASTALGAQIRIEKGILRVTGPLKHLSPQKPIDCQESASTIRFFTPIAALVEGTTVLSGSPSLKKRPIGALIKALNKIGVECSSQQGFPPVSVKGGEIRGGITYLPGHITSQFISGLLFACPLAKAETRLYITTPLESKPYVELTLHILTQHAIKIEVTPNFRRFNIPSQQYYTAQNHVVPGDFSSASFLMVAAAITDSKIVIENLQPNVPDYDIINILNRMGVNIAVNENSVEVNGGELSATTIDARDIPDLVPPCAVLACHAKGETRIYNAQRLKIKESNRLQVLSTELRKMGAEILTTTDGLRIKGPNQLHGATLDPHNDHRIAMACAIAGLNSKGETIILNAECVNKSYPTFYDDMKILGANIIVR